LPRAHKTRKNLAGRPCYSRDLRIGCYLPANPIQELPVEISKVANQLAKSSNADANDAMKKRKDFPKRCKIMTGSNGRDKDSYKSCFESVCSSSLLQLGLHMPLLSSCSCLRLRVCQLQLSKTRPGLLFKHSRSALENDLDLYLNTSHFPAQARTQELDLSKTNIELINFQEKCVASCWVFICKMTRVSVCVHL
jgi:hypothetical protein